MIQDRALDGCRFLSPPRRGGVLAAVSGGVDSTALALTLAASPACRPLHLAWVRHGFRGRDPEEEVVVHGLARALDLPLHVLSDRRPTGRGAGTPIPEAWARERRWARLAALARTLGLPVIALGHQRQDAVETRLLQLLRGGFLRAMAGMAGHHHRNGLLVWRPLLDLDRRIAEERVSAAGLRTFQDPSNASLDQRRNLVRHRLLPAMHSLQDPWLARQDRLAQLAQRALGRIQHSAHGFLDRWLEPTCRTTCCKIADQHLHSLSPAMLYHLWEALAERLAPHQVGLEGTEEHGTDGRGFQRRPRRSEWREAVAWLQQPGARGERVIGVLRVHRSLGWLAVEPDDRTVNGPRDQWQVRLGAQPVQPSGLRWSIRQRTGAVRNSESPGSAAGEHDQMVLHPTGPLLVRAGRAGEQLRLQNGHCRALKEALFRHGVPSFDRHAWPVVCDTDGPIWIPRLWHAPRARSGPLSKGGAHLVEVRDLPRT